ncbi:MAG: helix-turn-helix domain-containing protein, partial [Candidatus Dormibacteraeota bacterium]|nr:helix-turn-helix domain-containing protein [Candidatus Dormibacteraeota bacterium]
LVPKAGAARDPRGSWLTLHAAAARLDVHPATLRHWSDRGRLTSYRTPGGHRRFLASDVDGLQAARPRRSGPDLDLLQHAALGRARLELSGGRLAGEAWFDSGAHSRERWQALGRDLLLLAVRSLGGDRDAVAEGRRLGRRYGVMARRAGVAPADAVRACLYFRNLMVESADVVRPPHDTGVAAGQAQREIGAFLDEVIVAMLEPYSGEPA